MENNFGYIYLTTNLVNGKIYVGKHQSSKHDTRYIGSGRYFLKALRKYGKENFENRILEWCSSKEQLDERECYWIEIYGSLAKDGHGYNLALGGEGGNTIAGYSQIEYDSFCKKLSDSGKIAQNRPEVKEKLRDASSGKNNPMYGRAGGKSPAAKGVVCVIENKMTVEYESLTQAIRAFGGFSTNCSIGKIMGGILRGEEYRGRKYKDKFSGVRLYYKEEYRVPTPQR